MRGIKKRARRLTLALLSRRRSLYSTGRLLQAARERSLKPILLDSSRVSAGLVDGRLTLSQGGVAIHAPDVAIPRMASSSSASGLALARQLELMGVPLLNGSEAIAQSRDKLRSLQMLARAGIPVPRSIFAPRRTEVEPLLGELEERFGGLPVILKLLHGTHGVGVMLASTREEARSALATLFELGEELLVQEFVGEAEGADLRALVVGERVVATMRRRARAGEFRANLHRGGDGSRATLSDEAAALAVKAARAVGLEVAGVDLIESKRGPLILELNASPGLEGIERSTGVDVAGAMVDRALELLALG